MTKSNKLTFNIDPDLIAVIVDKSGDIVLEPTIEDKIAKLLHLQELIDNAIIQIKDNIKLKVNEHNPTLKSIQSDKLKIQISPRGSKYKLNIDEVNNIPKNFVKKSIRYTPNSIEIDEYLENNQELPRGIDFVSRNKTVSLKLKDNPDVKD